MRIIDSIEINYFRSIYQSKLKNLDDLNVFIGGNDSVKSNVLRALNLFFNNEISDFEEFSFLEDVTHSRQDEAKEAKGRLTIWIKVTFNNFENWKTLPEKFSVKKVWNRYAELPEVTYDAQNQTSVTKFLNKINFHYVPAVKTQDIYSYYLRNLYESLSTKQDLDLLAPAAALSNTVNGAVFTMSDRIRNTTGVESKIHIPSNFSELFERLSFSTQIGEYFVPLNKRGDGIQARHIPHILEYISENNGKNNIWAYEEPENSLELASAFELARQFEEDFSTKNQLFITSHSPAFYGLEGENTTKFFVEKIPYNNATISKTSPLKEIDKVDGVLGISQLVSQKSKVLFEEIRILKNHNDALHRLTLPSIVTEGTTDAAIIKEAIKRIFGDEEKYHVFCCESSEGIGGGHTNLKTLMESIPAKESYKRFGIFDRDKGGLNSFANLKGFSAHGSADCKIRSCGNIFAALLPDVNWDDPYFELAGRPVAIEQMFSPDIIGRDIISYNFTGATGSLRRADVDELVRTQGVDLTRKLVSTRIEISDKRIALKRIRKAPDEAFSVFENLLLVIDKSLNQPVKIDR